MFYEKYSALCKSYNMSAVAVAKELGLSNAAPTHWKNGKIPGGETLIAIADYFNVSIDWLLDRTENRHSHLSGSVSIKKVGETKGKLKTITVYDILNDDPMAITMDKGLIAAEKIIH